MVTKELKSYQDNLQVVQIPYRYEEIEYSQYDVHLQPFLEFRAELQSIMLNDDTLEIADPVSQLADIVEEKMIPYLINNEEIKLVLVYDPFLAAEALLFKAANLFKAQYDDLFKFHIDLTKRYISEKLVFTRYWDYTLSYLRLRLHTEPVKLKLGNERCEVLWQKAGQYIKDKPLKELKDIGHLVNSKPKSNFPQESNFSLEELEINPAITKVPKSEVKNWLLRLSRINKGSNIKGMTPYLSNNELHDFAEHWFGIELGNLNTESGPSTIDFDTFLAFLRALYLKVLKNYGVTQAIIYQNSKTWWPMDLERPKEYRFKSNFARATDKSVPSIHRHLFTD